MKRALQTWLGGMLSLTLLACGEPPPPPKPPPEPAPEPEPPPPPPKCEALKEKCKADASTRLQVLSSDYQFTPPKGWIYAKLEEAAVAQTGDEGAVIVITSYVPDKTVKTQRLDMAQSFSELVLVEPPSGLSMTNPNTSQKIAGLSMQLWEKTGAKRGKDTGGLLILAATIGDRELFGLGFAPKDDEAGTAAILAAIQSLEAVGAKEDKEEKDVKEEKDKDKDGK